MKRKTLLNIGRIGIEVVLGATAGWFITDNYIHPPETKYIDNFVAAIIGYGKQIRYDAIGSAIGAVTFPILDFAYRTAKKNT